MVKRLAVVLSVCFVVATFCSSTRVLACDLLNGVCSEYTDGSCCGFDCDNYDVPNRHFSYHHHRHVPFRENHHYEMFSDRRNDVSIGVVICENAETFGCADGDALVSWERFVANKVGVSEFRVQVKGLQVLDDKGRRVAVKFVVR